MLQEVLVVSTMSVRTVSVSSPTLHMPTSNVAILSIAIIASSLEAVIPLMVHPVLACLVPTHVVHMMASLGLTLLVIAWMATSTSAIAPR